MKIHKPFHIAVACLFTCCITQLSVAQVLQDGVLALPVVNAETGEAVEMAVFEIDDEGIKSGIRIRSEGTGGPGMTVISGTRESPDNLILDPWEMLNNPSVQKDLELVGDQLAKVQELQSQFSREMEEQIRDVSSGELSSEDIQDMRILMEQLRSAQRKTMQSVLLPHQIARLQQVAFQTHFVRSGTAEALGTGTVAESLGISKEQILRLKSRGKEINEQLEIDIAALKKEAHDELLNELTPKQKDKLKELIGEKFEPQIRDWPKATPETLRKESNNQRGGN